MREIRLKVNKIARALQRRAERTEQAPIYIQELIAIQQNADKNGEFKQTRYGDETPEELVTRLANYILMLMEHTAKIHLKNNGDKASQNYLFPSDLQRHAVANLLNKRILEEKKSVPIFPDEIKKEIEQLSQSQKKPLLDENKLNFITRLLLQEFGLYPHMEIGALTTATFQLLLEQINKIAALFPENCHLLLGTIPVTVEMKNEDPILQQLGIYVECGEFPKIHVFSKAFPSHLDPIYCDVRPLSSLPFDKKQEDVLARTKTLLSHLRVLPDNLDATLANIKVLQTLCLDFKLASPFFYQEAKAALDTVEHNLRNNRYKNNLKLLKDDRDRINTNVYRFIRRANAFEGPLIALRGNEGKGFDIHYGGEFTTKTAGQETLRVVAEVCLDHAYAVAKNKVTKMDTLAAKKGTTILPMRISHVITSNSTLFRPENQVGYYATQADADTPRVDVLGQELKEEAKGTISLDAPPFGPPTLIRTYPPYELKAQQDQEAIHIKTHNAFVIQLEALRIYRIRHPLEINYVDRMINQHILKPFVSKLLQPHYCHDKKSEHNPIQEFLHELQTSSYLFSETRDLIKLLQSAKEHYTYFLSKEEYAEFDKAIDDVLALTQSELDASLSLRNEMGDLVPYEFDPDLTDSEYLTEQLQLKYRLNPSNITLETKDEAKSKPKTFHSHPYFQAPKEKWVVVFQPDSKHSDIAKKKR